MIKHVTQGNQEGKHTVQRWRWQQLPRRAAPTRSSSHAEQHPETVLSAHWVRKKLSVYNSTLSENGGSAF